MFSQTASFEDRPIMATLKLLQWIITMFKIEVAIHQGAPNNFLSKPCQMSWFLRHVLIVMLYHHITYRHLLHNIGYTYIYRYILYTYTSLHAAYTILDRLYIYIYIHIEIDR